MAGGPGSPEPPHLSRARELGYPWSFLKA
jgi:hypothetical protein